MGTVLGSAAVGVAIALFTPIPQMILPFLPAPLGGIATDGLRQLGVYSLGRPVTVLIMGVDHLQGETPDATEQFQGLSDTMLLMRFDPEEERVSLLSIPRDTQVRIPDVGLTKINEANIYGGPRLATKVVSNTLNGVEVDRYVRVTTDIFKELVDAVGGVNVLVPFDMKYTDQTQNLEINLDKGWQVLDGEQAEHFVRFRQAEFGDIGRVQRQQALLKALGDKIKSPAIIPRLPALIGLLQDHIDTDLSWEEMMALVNVARQLKQDNFQMVMLPGRFSEPGEYERSFWVISEPAKDQVMTEFFGVEAPAWADLDFRDEVLSENILIAVQNATGAPGIAGQVSNYLQARGFRNIYLARDYSETIPETLIIAQQGNVPGAEQLQSILEVGQVEASSIGEIESVFTIRVGEDWLER